MRITAEKLNAITGIIGLIGLLFGKGGRAQRIATILDSVPGRLFGYRDARVKIDQLAEKAERDGPGEQQYQVTLTYDEMRGLDDALDLLHKSGRGLRRLVRNR